MMSEELILAVLAVVLGGSALKDYYSEMTGIEAFLKSMFLFSILSVGGILLFEYRSKAGRDRRKRIKTLKGVPSTILRPSENAVYLGFDEDLKTRLYFPDSIRRRHVHILGATGSGKTESVILNLLKQDVQRGLGAIILDAKGDFSFLQSLTQFVPDDRLRVFDLGSESSKTYDPLAAGSDMEAAQRLFSSLTWSEPYYKSKAFSAIQRILHHFTVHMKRRARLIDLDRYLQDPRQYAALVSSDAYPAKLAEKDFGELSGLRDQISTLCTGYLGGILSPENGGEIRLDECKGGKVFYFRLQSLMSPQLVGVVGKLVMNHLSYIAGFAHRDGEKSDKLIPVYLDEFASFACPEFADLISKARSAGFALHFSHQSIGDLAEVAEGFINRITDNAGTKIVLRINDPESAEFFARSFGTRLYQKTTQRITNAEEIELAEVVGEGTQREAHRFRASPDLLKTLPTGMGAVLIAHGEETPEGASHVFRVRFPRWAQDIRQ